MKRPVEQYTPIKASDSEHGSTVTLGTKTDLWGTTRIQQDRISFVCNRAAPVAINDILVIETAQYRVIDIRKPLATMNKSLALERIAKPVSP